MVTLTRDQVYLAMEEREVNASGKAEHLIASFTYAFYNMSFTLHPCGLPNEAPGKSSNVSWAALQILTDYPSAQQRQRTIVTTMDGMCT